jgi:hypothetical protein
VRDILIGTGICCYVLIALIVAVGVKASKPSEGEGEAWRIGLGLFFPIVLVMTLGATIAHWFDWAWDLPREEVASVAAGVDCRSIVRSRTLERRRG